MYAFTSATDHHTLYMYTMLDIASTVVHANSKTHHEDSQQVNYGEQLRMQEETRNLQYFCVPHTNNFPHHQHYHEAVAASAIGMSDPIEDK